MTVSYCHRLFTTSLIGLDRFVRYLYHGSLYRMLSDIYPHIDWVPWRFASLPRTDKGIWNETREVQEFVQYLEGIFLFFVLVAFEGHCLLLYVVPFVVIIIQMFVCCNCNMKTNL